MKYYKFKNVKRFGIFRFGVKAQSEPDAFLSWGSFMLPLLMMMVKYTNSTPSDLSTGNIIPIPSYRKLMRAAGTKHFLIC